MCKKLFQAAESMSDCPIRLTPQCHPHASVDVYIHARKRLFYLCCSKCDRVLSPIKTRKPRK